MTVLINIVLLKIELSSRIIVLFELFETVEIVLSINFYDCFQLMCVLFKNSLAGDAVALNNDNINQIISELIIFY